MAASCGKFCDGGADLVFLTFLLGNDLFRAKSPTPRYHHGCAAYDGGGQNFYFGNLPAMILRRTSDDMPQGSGTSRCRGAPLNDELLQDAMALATAEALAVALANYSDNPKLQRRGASEGALPKALLPPASGR